MMPGESTAIEIGRLLRAGTSGFVVGCRVSQAQGSASASAVAPAAAPAVVPSFGTLVKAPVSADYQIYGLIYDIHIDDDGLVRQLVTAEGVDENIINDNRMNRNVPLEMSVLAVGYRRGERILHLLPPRPPLSLDVIYLCRPAELRAFTDAGRFGYFRHVLRATDLPTGELLAAHVQQAQAAHAAAGDASWGERATQELITLLRDDYPTLMSVLGALGDAAVTEM
jgi:hypothetical protein